MRRFAESVGVRGQGGVDGGLERGVGWMAAHREVLVLELAPNRFDRIEFGAVGRQKAERDVRRLQVRERGRDGTAVVNRKLSRTTTHGRALVAGVRSPSAIWRTNAR